MKYLIYNHQGAALPVLLPEALGAGDVSVTVAEQSKCGRCYGTGWYESSGTGTCPNCDGTGQRRVAVPLKPVGSGVAEVVCINSHTHVVLDHDRVSGPEWDAIERMLGLSGTPPVSEFESPAVCALCGAAVQSRWQPEYADADATVLCHRCFAEQFSVELTTHTRTTRKDKHMPMTSKKAGENIAEFHHGARYKKLVRKQGKARADKVAVAAGLEAARKAKGRDEKKTQATATGGWPDIIGAGSVIPGEPTVT